MRKRPGLLFACIFLTGIVFQKYQWKILWLVPLIFLVLEIYFGHKDRIRMAGRSLLLLSAFFLGIGHMKSEVEFRNTYMSKLEDGSEAVIFGEILTTQETEYGSRLFLTDCYVSLKETTIPCNQVMVYVSSDQYRIGQVYQIKGKVHLFEHARNEGNFNSAVFYQSQKIDFSVYASECSLLGYEENILRDAIFTLKERLTQGYKKSMEEDAAGFYIGMMLGDKSFLSDRTKELFAMGGISHILAISGLHMSIIGRGFYKILRKCHIGFLIAGVLASLLLFTYCYMVGNGTSAIRAVAMMLLFFIGQYLGRSYDMLNSLGIAIIYLLWKNPFLIEYSGFQFSVAALVGVGFVGQRLTSDFQKSAGLWMSMGITLTTLPVVASCYFEIPLYSPFINSLILPMLSPIFALALFGGLLACVFPTIGYVILLPCNWLYRFYVFVCEFVENLPYGNMITGKPQMKVAVLYYVVLCAGIVILRMMERQKIENNQIKLFSIRKMIIKLLLVFTCFFLILYPRKPESEIIFLDVGQGDGIFVASQDGTTCFIDGGSSDVNEVGDYRILPFLKAHGVKAIDYWFVSHADTDHMSGLLEVMEMGYKIHHLVISDKMPEDENREKLIFLAERQEISIIQMKAGECIQSRVLAGGIQITCFYPWSDAMDRNEQSMVLLVEFFDENTTSIYKAFFSGDISSEAEIELIRKGILEDVDLYKAAHHGSKYSNSKAFLDVIQPEICVISCGKDNSYGHPHEEVIERLEDLGIELVYTMERGQVRIMIPSEQN